MMLRIGAGRVARAGEGESDVMAVFSKAFVAGVTMV